MLSSIVLMFILVKHSATFEFESSQCLETSIPKLCHVKIHKGNPDKNGSTQLEIKLKINRPFERIPLDQQDIIDRQIIAAKKRHQRGTLYGMDQGTAALVQLMSSLSDQPKSYDEAYRKYKKKQLENFEFFRNNPSQYSNWIHGTTQARFATNYWDDTVEIESFLLPAVQLIFYGKRKLKAVLRNEDDGSWTLLQPGGRIVRINRSSRGTKTKANFLLPFDPEEFSLSLLDEEDRILDHLGTQTNFSHRGAYLILNNFEVLPRYKLSSRE